MYQGPGKYRHFKGQHYYVVGLARHTETGEAMVLYIPLYGQSGWCVRPLTSFDSQPSIGEDRFVLTLI